MIRILLVSMSFLTFAAHGDTIKVYGSAKVYAAPDKAVINFKMVTKDKSSVSAQKENSSILKNVFSGLKKKFSVDKSDIATTQYTLTPRYHYPRDKAPVFTAMEVSNSVRVKLNNTKDVSKVLDYLTRSGVSNINSIEFVSSREKNLRLKALSKAFEDAKRKATALAKKSNVELGEVKSVSEHIGQVPGPVYSGSLMKSESYSPAIESGSKGVAATVEVTYHIGK